MVGATQISVPIKMISLSHCHLAFDFDVGSAQVCGVEVSEDPLLPYQVTKNDAEMLQLVCRELALADPVCKIIKESNFKFY
jgi:hypothetical protein